MIEYTLEVKMADKNLPIDAEIKEMIYSCVEEANNSTVSIKYKRTFIVEDVQPDQYTIIIKIKSRDSINPTRSMATITRAVTRNERYYNLVKNHIVNGLIFQSKLISEDNLEIIHLEDTEIVSEIISLFFGKTQRSDSEKILIDETSTEIRKIMLEYINKKNRL